jgi:hypothetical protein
MKSKFSAIIGRSLTTLLFVCSFTLAVPLNAQLTGGTLLGTVTDPSGATVPNAQISAANVATGVVTKATTNADGLYTAPNLLPGTYQVTVASAGFSTQVLNGVAITVGAQKVVNAVLQVGQVRQEVVVSDEAPTIQLASSSISDIVNATTVRELPLNGRSWTDLATLQPGVANPQMQPPFNGGRGQRGFGNQIAISGSRPQENNYRLDGASVNDYANGGPGNVEGGALGVDAIQEFSVLTSTYPAEYGRTSGGVINAITRSGTNSLHGDAYEFFRNNALDAKNYFDLTRPAFHRNQFGGSLGGPIVKDKAFFFADYEGLRESKGATQTDTVLSPAARAGNLSTGQVTVDPAIASFINAFYPLPNGALLGAGDTAKLSVPIQRLNLENFFTTRLDDNISSKDTLHGTFVYDNTNLTIPDEFNSKLQSFLVGRKIFTAEETHTFSSQFLNSVRFGFSRTPANVGATNTAVMPAAKDPAFGAIPTRDAPDVKVSGLTEFTGGLGGPSNYNFHYNSIQGYDDAFVTRGKHSLKFGFAVERIRDNVTAATDRDGVFSFGSLAQFLTNQPTNFKGAIPSTVTGRSIRQTIFGGYAQDDWHLRQNLTLNLGLRYEMVTLPTENNGKLSILRNISDPLPHLGEPFFLSNPTTKNFEPRVGFAWDPFSNGKTALRGGFGIFDVLPLPYQFNFEYVFTAPFFSEGLVSKLATGSFPTGAFPLIAANSSTLRQNYAPSNPPRNYVMQYNLNVQQQISQSFVATIAYAGQRGIHQPFRSEDINMVLPTKIPQGYLWPTPSGSGTRINPNAGVIRGLFYNGHSYYDSLETQLSKLMKHGFQAQVAYTFSRNIDTGTAGVAGDTFANSIPGLLWFDTKLNRGLSDLNITHNLVVNYTWTLPGTNGMSGPVAWALNGWQLGGIYRASSGVPFSVPIGGDPLGELSDHAFDVPNRLSGPGCGSLVNPGNPVQYIKTQCFSFPTAPDQAFYNANCDPKFKFPNCGNLRGNAGRNILTGPGLSNFDFSLFKNNRIPRISEQFNAQFRVEVFNILNHANFAPPLDNNTLFDQKGNVVSGAGLIDGTASPERQIQLALKLIW